MLNGGLANGHANGHVVRTGTEEFELEGLISGEEDEDEEDRGSTKKA
jgi:hypothetical protein